MKPTKLQQLRAFVRKAKKVIGDPGLATSEVREERMVVCAECPKNVDFKCEACGCPLHRLILPKVPLCELKKWTR